MKSQVNGLTTVALGLLADVLAAYPTIRGVDRDVVRLTTLVKERGMGVYTLDLPALDAILLDALSTGILRPSGPLSRVVSKKARVPRFFSGLWRMIFDKNGMLLEQADPTAIAFLRQIFSLGKKMEVGCSPKRHNDAVKEFYHVEAESRVPTLSWDSDELYMEGDRPCLDFHQGRVDDSLPLYPFLRNCEVGDKGRRLSLTLANLHRICDRFAIGLGIFDSVSVSDGFVRESHKPGVRHGPGATAETGRTGWKFGLSWNWPLKLDHVFPIDYFGYPNMDIQERDFSRHEPPSRLVAVPKTAKGPRLIAAEPLAHQWCQQLVAKWFTRSLHHQLGAFASINDQEPSRSICYNASTTGSLATVDLSSASDRLTCWAIERAFRRNPTALEAFHACRTRWIRIDHNGQPDYIRLRKFSTQGSALTFPVQTFFFLACALAVLPRERTLGEYAKKWAGKVRVFGDDIIVPRAGYADLCDLLEYLGLKVNRSKSFSTGRFRESCGMDAWGGYDVTPIKSRSLRSDTAETLTSLTDYSNNLFEKGYWNASKAVDSILGSRFCGSLPVVQVARRGREALSGTLSRVSGQEARVSASLHRTSFCGYRDTHLRRRWGQRYQRPEVQALVVNSSARRKSMEGDGCLLQYFVESPKSDTPWRSGLTPVPSVVIRRAWVPAFPDQ